MLHDDRIREQAVAWAVRAGDPAFDEWDAFIAWLEEDPRHAAAYDQVAGTAAEVAEALPVDTGAVPAAANDEDVAPRRWRAWLPAAIAACLALVLGISLWGGGDRYTVETAPGEIRMVSLEDGSHIDIAGGSRIVLDRDNPRFASLESGQALFTIRHDEAAPFLLDAGEDRLLDAGTVFDVRLTDAGLSVGVSEGAVVFNPDGQNVRLVPGDVLTSPHGSDVYEVGSMALAQVGEWLEGRLSFQDAPLDEVAAELTRATGIVFVADSSASGQRLSGSILVEPVRDNPRSLGPLLGVSVRPDGQQWLIGMP